MWFQIIFDEDAWRVEEHSIIVNSFVKIIKDYRGFEEVKFCRERNSKYPGGKYFTFLTEAYVGKLIHLFPKIKFLPLQSKELPELDFIYEDILKNEKAKNTVH